MQSVLPSDIIQHHVHNIAISQNASPWDLHWGMPTSNGKFTVSSAYHLVRHRKKLRFSGSVCIYIWCKGVPLKINFFLWRLWKFKITVEDIL